MAMTIARLTTLSTSFVNVYGGDLDAIGNDGFIWSARMKISLRGA